MEEKTDAIVLAGGKRGFSLRRYCQIINDAVEDMRHYGHFHISSGYKALYRFKGNIGGVVKERPLVEYTLRTLQDTPSIERIFLVGPKKEIEKELSDRLHTHYDKVVVLEQTESFGGNVRIGYACAGDKGKKLVMTCDAPETKPKEVTELLGVASEYAQHRFIFPVIPKEVIEKAQKDYGDKRLKVFRRRPFMLIPDTMNELEGLAPDYDAQGRRGFRLAPFAYGDFSGIDGTLMDELFGLRKFLRPSVIKKLYRLLKSHETLNRFITPNLYGQYQNGIKQSEIEQLIEAIVLTRTPNIPSFPVKIVQLSNAGSTFDVDTSGDLREIQKLSK